MACVPTSGSVRTHAARRLPFGLCLKAMLRDAATGGKVPETFFTQTLGCSPPRDAATFAALKLPDVKTVE